MDIGKYDEDSKALLIKQEAALTAVLIIGGKEGNGFSVSSVDPKLTLKLPELLNSMAENIAAQQQKMK